MRTVDDDLTLHKAGLFDSLDNRILNEIGEIIGTYTRMSRHLHGLRGAALLEAYRATRQTDTGATARMVRLGEDDDRHVREITALCVRLLELVEAWEQAA